MTLHYLRSLSPTLMVRAAAFCAAATLAGLCAAQPYGASGPGDGPMGGPMNGGPMGGPGGAMGHGYMMRGGAVATLGPTEGNTVTGLVRFDQRGDTVWVHAHVVGLAPNSVHGFHIHEKGSCASADGTSAGGHFNPEGHHHGPQDAEHHAGDMPNLSVDAQGRDRTIFTLPDGTFAGLMDEDGAALVIHANADDYKTDPSGNSGGRIACGVIVAN